VAELPTIDIAPLSSPDPTARRRTADEMGEAARTIGFFYVVNHGIRQSMIHSAYEKAEAFFAQPDHVKRSYYIGNSTNHRGYVPFTEKGDYADEVNRNYEAFDLALDLPHTDPDYRAGNLLLGPNVWPMLPGFQQTIDRYYRAVASLGRRICTGLEIHLELPAGQLTGQMSKPISQLRLLHYVRDRTINDIKSVNMGAHTDYECLTLLHQRQKGLQVMTRDDHWIDVPVQPEAYIINIGDMMEAWTNGAFKSTPHRVLNLSSERFSMPYFVAANYDTVIEPFEKLVTSSTPAKYSSFKAGLHLERMLLRDFPYLRKRRSAGVWATADGDAAPVNNPFENRLNSVGAL